jgi:hypothetical protein
MTVAVENPEMADSLVFVCAGWPSGRVVSMTITLMKSGGGAALMELTHGLHNSKHCGCYPQVIATMQQGWQATHASLLDALRCAVQRSAAAGAILAACQLAMSVSALLVGSSRRTFDAHLPFGMGWKCNHQLGTRY